MEKRDTDEALAGSKKFAVLFDAENLSPSIAEDVLTQVATRGEASIKKRGFMEILPS